MKKIVRITTVPQSLRVLLKGQLKYMSSHFNVIAVSSKGDCFDAVVKEQGVRGVEIEMSRKITPIKDFIALVKLIIFLRKEKPFIVHTHTPKAGTLGMIAAKISRVPHRLHTVAGLPLLETTGSKRILLNSVEKITYKCATTIYPNSNGLKEIILNNKLAPDWKLEVIGNGSSNGIDTSYFSAESIDIDYKKIKYHLNINSESFVFCFVGRIVRDKGIEELIRAFTELNRNFSNIHLILVGSFEKDLDPISPEIENQIQNNKNISFTDYQYDVRPYLAISNALVFPSYREGFPNVVMQAGAMGLPSIVTNINGCNEIIINGENGVIIPPKDKNALLKAMNYFIEQKDGIVKEMAKKARPMIVNRYDQKKVWEAILAEYKKLK